MLSRHKARAGLQGWSLWSLAGLPTVMKNLLLASHKPFLKVSICAVTPNKESRSLFLFKTMRYLFTYFLVFYCTGWNTEEVFHLPSQTTPLGTFPPEGGCHPPAKAISFHKKGYKVHWARKRYRTQVWPWAEPQGSLQAQSRSLKSESVSSYHS